MNSISVNAPQLSDIVGGHFVDGVLDMNDINDEDMITTKTSSGTKMRMTVYNTYPEKGINLNINCVKKPYSYICKFIDKDKFNPILYFHFS